MNHRCWAQLQTSFLMWRRMYCFSASAASLQVKRRKLSSSIMYRLTHLIPSAAPACYRQEEVTHPKCTCTGDQSPVGGLHVPHMFLTCVKSMLSPGTALRPPSIMAAWEGMTPKVGRQLKSGWPSYRNLHDNVCVSELQRNIAAQANISFVSIQIHAGRRSPHPSEAAAAVSVNTPTWGGRGPWWTCPPPARTGCSGCGWSWTWTVAASVPLPRPDRGGEALEAILSALSTEKHKWEHKCDGLQRLGFTFGEISSAAQPLNTKHST